MEKVYRVLIIKLGALGDAVMASSMLAALRAGRPKVHITWLCGTEIEALVPHFKGVDEVITVNNRLLGGSKLNKIRFVLSAWRKIALKSYDLCITAHSDRSYALLPLFTRCKEKRLFRGALSPREYEYHGDSYARLAGGTGSHRPAQAAINASYIAKDMILLLPGGARNVMDMKGVLRAWPVEYYQQLAAMLLEKGLKVGIVGGPGDIWTEEFFKDMDVTSFIGKTTVPELIALLAGAKAFVTHDSGPLHFAYLPVKGAEEGRPACVALFGPTPYQGRIPDGALYPDAKTAVLHSSRACAPCYDGRFYADCPSNECMREIAAAKVCETLMKLF